MLLIVVCVFIQTVEHLEGRNLKTCMLMNRTLDNQWEKTKFSQRTYMDRLPSGVARPSAHTPPPPCTSKSDGRAVAILAHIGHCMIPLVTAMDRSHPQRWWPSEAHALSLSLASTSSPQPSQMHVKYQMMDKTHMGTVRARFGHMCWAQERPKIKLI